MKKTYEKPLIEVENFDSIETSGDGPSGLLQFPAVWNGEDD